MRNSSDQYEPVECGFHDQLVERATLQRPTKIAYDNRGEQSVVQGVIEDVFSRQGAEYLRLTGGIEIRLDKITDVID